MGKRRHDGIYGNRHFGHKHFTIRERVALGEIALYWLSGKLNPADVTTKALDKAITVAHSGAISGHNNNGCGVSVTPVEFPVTSTIDPFLATKRTILSNCSPKPAISFPYT